MAEETRDYGLRKVSKNSLKFSPAKIIMQDIYYRTSHLRRFDWIGLSRDF